MIDMLETRANERCALRCDQTLQFIKAHNAVAIGVGITKHGSYDPVELAPLDRLSLKRPFTGARTGSVETAAPATMAAPATAAREAAALPDLRGCDRADQGCQQTLFSSCHRLPAARL